jgi:hypothetical protein
MDEMMNKFAGSPKGSGNMPAHPADDPLFWRRTSPGLLLEARRTNPQPI